VFYTGWDKGKLAEIVPFPVDRVLLERGQERYRIFCVPCHAESGDGRGMIVRRGFNPPPPYYSEELRQQPIGHFFDVMTRGYGTMYSYATRVPPRDRWAIAAYIRVLQLSQHAEVAALSEEDKNKLPAGGSQGQGQGAGQGENQSRRPQP
jgi:Cytochrome C oxidase, cbb3-type, subunit III